MEFDENDIAMYSVSQVVEIKTSTDKDYTKILSNDCLLRIFSYFGINTLLEISKVCRRWNVISKDRTLWRTVDLTLFTYMLDEYSFTNTVRSRLKHAFRLNLGGLRVSQNMMHCLAVNCKQLKVLLFGRNSSLEEDNNKGRQRKLIPTSVVTLDIRSAKGNFDFLLSARSSFSKLLHLGVGPRSFTRMSLTMLFWKLPNLKVVDFTNCLEIDDLSLQILAQECPAIESLCLIGCRNVFGSTFGFLLKHCKNLKTLLIRYLRLEDHILASSIWRNSVIEELDISACSRITWQGLYAFLPQLKSLKYLNMSYCGDGHAVNDAVLYELISQGVTQRLKMLDMRWSFYITPHALSSFLPKCLYLENLGLYQSFKITAFDISEIVASLKSIRIFEFGGSFTQELNQCKLIENLTSNVNNLEVLSLINFTSNDTFQDFCNLVEFIERSKTLTRINFCDCSPDLIDIGRSAVKNTKVEITTKWECALPPPKLTLDSIVS